MPLGKKRTGKVQNSIDDVENLVINAAILMALILSFVAALLYTPGPDSFDRLNFRQSAYGWPNDSFAKFVTVELEENQKLNISEVILRRQPYGYGKGGEHGLQNTDPDMEEALTLAFANIPSERLYAFFQRYPDELIAVRSYAHIFYWDLIGSAVILVVGVVISMIAYVSLTMSEAREDESGRVLAMWSKYGVPVTIALYIMVLIAMIFFLIATGNYVFVLDFVLPFNFGKIFAYLMYFVTVPVGFLGAIYFTWVWYQTRDFGRENEASSTARSTTKI